MPDLIREQIDLKAKLADVYAFAEDPANALVTSAKQVAGLQRDGAGRVTSFKTKRGAMKYTLHAFPHYWEGEYLTKRTRARYEVRLEAIGEAATRVMIDINLQPQGLRAKLQGPIPRWRAKGQLNDWLEQAQKRFNNKK